MMDPAMHLTLDEEKKRYDQHNNDVNDPGYRQFVKPLVDKVLQDYSPQAKGLDFGAGPGPVATVMLREKDFHEIAIYDPIYRPDRALLDDRFYFIICIEVIEHFRFPFEYFKLLRSLLLPAGSLYCMTALYDDDIDFEQWYYKNDPTHVFFYHRNALQWIKKQFSFSEIFIKDRLIQFTVKG